MENFEKIKKKDTKKYDHKVKRKYSKKHKIKRRNK